jgi:hypothetical protein
MENLLSGRSAAAEQAHGYAAESLTLFNNSPRVLT